MTKPTVSEDGLTTSDTDDGLTASERTSGLRRSLTQRHITMIAIGGAIGTGLFMGSGRTVSFAGPSIIFIYALIGFFVFFIMRALGELLLSNLHYKTFADLAKDLIAPWAGFFVNWNYWFACVVAAIADVVAITGYMAFFNDRIPTWVIAVVAASVIFFFNLQPVKWFGELEFWFAVSKVVTILALIAVGSWMIITGFVDTDGTTASLSNLWNRGGLFSMGFSGFVLGFQLAMYSFSSVELVGTVAAETQDPQKTLPKAINSIILRIVIFYIGALTVIMAITPWDTIDPNQSPFITVFYSAGFKAAAGVVGLVVIISAASSGNAQTYAAIRMLYGMAKDSHAPKMFSKLSKGNIPLNAALFTAGLTYLAVPLLFASESIISAFTFVTSICSTLMLFTWGSFLVSYLRYRKLHPERHESSSFKMPLGLVMPWIIFAFFGFLIFCYAQNPETRVSLYAVPFWFLLLTILWQQRRRSLIRAGRPVTSPVPPPDYDPARDGEYDPIAYQGNDQVETTDPVEKHK